MLNKKDLKAIGNLLDQKLNKRLKATEKRFDEKLDDICSTVNEGFSAMQKQFDELRGDVEYLKKEVEKRPTREEIFSWADRRFTDLEIAKDRHDYLHINELDKLPSPAKINKVLIERGFKEKLV